MAGVDGIAERLARRIRTASWFAAVGELLIESEIADAQGYLAGLGFAGGAVQGVASWREAEALIRDPCWNRDWWEAEEARRRALLGDKPSAELLAALTSVTELASGLAYGAAAAAMARAGVADQALIRVAAGAAAQAGYLAALEAANDSGAAQPFALRLQLFEGGRWPLCLIADRFYVF